MRFSDKGQHQFLTIINYLQGFNRLSYLSICVISPQIAVSRFVAFLNYNPASAPVSPYDYSPSLLINLTTISTLTKPQKRWRTPNADIYSFRVMISLAKEIISKKSKSNPISEIIFQSSSQPYTALHIEPTTSPSKQNSGSIFVAVFLVIVVSALSNFRQKRQFNKLSKISSNIKVYALREGRRQQISTFDNLVGDVVFLKIGDQIPADGLFLDGHSLQVDESSMTGESDHVEVDSKDNPFVFSGSKVADGYARMFVTSVGMNTACEKMGSTIA